MATTSTIWAFVRGFQVVNNVSHFLFTPTLSPLEPSLSIVSFWWQSEKRICTSAYLHICTSATSYHPLAKLPHRKSRANARCREPEKILGPLNLDEDTTADLRLTIGRRLTPKPVKVRADVEVKCFAYQGIEAIRKALAAGEACSTEEVPIKIRLVAPPLYVMSTTSTDKTAAIDVMEKAVEKIGEVITAEKGDLTIKMAVSQEAQEFDWGIAKRQKKRVLCVGADLRVFSQKSSRRRTMQSSKLSWINSKRQTWMSQVMMTRTRKRSRSRRCQSLCEGHGQECRMRYSWCGYAPWYTYTESGNLPACIITYTPTLYLTQST